MDIKQEQCQITLYEYLRLHAKENGKTTYFITETSAWTYEQVYETVNGLISYFIGNGVKKGTVIALRATRSPQTVMLVTALGAIGAQIALTDPHTSVQEFINNSGVDIMPEYYITNERTSLNLSEREGWEIVHGDKREQISFKKRISDLPEMPYGKVEDPFIIIFTSGSTGKAKAVVLSHRNCIANPVDAMPLFEENEKDRAISLLPLDHVFGFAVVVCATFCGHDVVFSERLETEYVLSCIEKYKVSVIYAVPSFFLGLLNNGVHKKYNLSSLRLGLMAGAPFTAEQLRYIENELVLQLMPGYGMSECVGVSTMYYGASVEDRATGVGKLYPMTEIKFTAEGEICVRGATLMIGYYNDEHATREVIDKDGWLHTGDLGYLDEKGFLHINGRIKDIIIRNGNNLSAVEIEKKILSIPQVKDVCVVGIPNKKDGEAPCAMIVAEEQVDLTTVLTKIEFPVKINYVQSIPLTSSGKYDKQSLKRIFTEIE